MKYLAGLNESELIQIATENQYPSFTGRQIYQWLYKKKVSSWEQMTNLSKDQRATLKAQYEIGFFAPETVQKSNDGTHKYLFKSPTLNSATRSYETVYIPSHKRHTLCLSSQVGCKMGCRFCQTAMQGFTANLSAREIINQVISVPQSKLLTNFVFMGMGEPLDNLTEVLKAIHLMTSPNGMGYSPRRITLSSVGVIPQMERFFKETSCEFALSLHSPFDTDRLKIMPVNAKYPIHKVLEVIKKTREDLNRKISFEYILLEGINDSPLHIKELVRILGNIRCLVNLLHFNPVPQKPYKSPPIEKMEWFKNTLIRHGLTATIRTSRGKDIFAACGMLSSLDKKHNTATN